MSRKIFWFAGLVLLIAVAWYILDPPPASARPGTVEVTFTVTYKSDGSAKIKVRSSNYRSPLNKSRGFICYDPVASKCQGEDHQLVWRAVGLNGGDALTLAAKDTAACNSGIFEGKTLTNTMPEAGPYPPTAPVDKKPNGKYCKFEYGLTVVDANGKQLGYKDPDIMPHGPGG